MKVIEKVDFTGAILRTIACVRCENYRAADDFAPKASRCIGAGESITNLVNSYRVEDDRLPEGWIVRCPIDKW